MDYQELISLYINKGLDITNLKEKLEIAKPLKGLLKYRAVDIIAQRSAILNDINNLLITLEKSEKVENFNKDVEILLEEYFRIITKSISSIKAWKFMKITPLEYTLEIFQNLNTKEKFKMIMFLNREYWNFLQYQNIADIRDCLKNANELNNDVIRKLEFLKLMFDKLKNREVKIEFFCFDKSFLISLIWSRKCKGLKLEDFMKSRKKSIQEEYKKFSQFFSYEDFNNVTENLELASKTLKVSVSNVIEAYSEMSESESEVYYIEEEFEQFKELLKKYQRMQIIKNEYEKQKKQILKQEKVRTKVELEKNQKELDNREISKKEKNKTSNQEKKYENVVPKEQVYPLIFSWLERDDITLTRRVGSKKLTGFFDKVKEIQEKSGIRISLYMLTNAGKNITLKRLEDFKKKAKQNGLSNLVEGALGGYSSFRIDKNGTITDIAEMSDRDRNDIIEMLENTHNVILTRDLVDKTEDSYIRYQITDKKEKNINKKYLNLIISNLLKEDNIRKKPLKFLLFMEGKKAGIDVLFEEQLKGISQLSEYYKEKYSIIPGKIMNVRIDNLELFIEE